MSWKTELFGYSAMLLISVVVILNLSFGVNICLALILELCLPLSGLIQARFLLLNGPHIHWPWPESWPIIVCALIAGVSSWRLMKICKERLTDLLFEDNWINKRK